MNRMKSFLKRECTNGCLIIIAAVLLGNAINILITNPDPIITRSGLGTSKETVIGEFNGTEVNDGAVSQSLGVASVNQILKGELPVWNHYEGVGAPLAGAMQPASFFLPFNLLLVLPNGFLIFRMVLEIIAGIGMFLFLRKLKVRNKIAIFGGILFALNGTFAILGNAIFNPIAFFPWMLFGLEKIKDELSKKTKIGYAIFALSLAFSINAGFPETAYLNGLLVFGWFLLRLFSFNKKDKMKYFCGVFLSGILGIFLALPSIYLFVHYLQNGAHIGGHDGTFQHLGIDKETIPMFIFPYIYGLIFQNPSITYPMWGEFGGFIGLTMLVLACFGVVNKKIDFKVRIFFALMAVVSLMRIVAVPIITHIIDILPLMAATAVFRYLPPVFILSTIVLACFGVEFGFQKKYSKNENKLNAGIAIIGSVVAGICLIVAKIFVKNKFIDGSGVRKYFIYYLILSIVIICLAVCFAKSKKHKSKIITALAFLAIFETMSSFALPQLGAPIRSKAKVDTDAVVFLQKNIGLQRFYYIGGKNGLKTNYASYFGISSINNENLPTPLAWDEFVKKNLDNNTDTISFSGAFRKDWSRDPAETEFYKNIENFKSVGVRYLVSEIQGDFAISREQAAKRGMNIVYSNDANNTIIYEMPNYSKYFSAKNCKLDIISRDEVMADCEKASKLSRLELFFDGWNVSVNDQKADLNKDGKIFQSVNLPAGKSKIKFMFWPKWLTLSLLIFSMSLIGIIAHQFYNVYIYLKSRKDNN